MLGAQLVFLRRNSGRGKVYRNGSGKHRHESLPCDYLARCWRDMCLRSTVAEARGRDIFPPVLLAVITLQHFPPFLSTLLLYCRVE